MGCVGYKRMALVSSNVCSAVLPSGGQGQVAGRVWPGGGGPGLVAGRAGRVGQSRAGGDGTARAGRGGQGRGGEARVDRDWADSSCV